MIRYVNLEQGTSKTVPVEPAIQQEYLGGLGLGVRLLADLDDPSLPPLHPRLPVIIAVGSLTATGFPGANRVAVTGVSPLTGLTSTSWMGGDFGYALAGSGTLALVLQGRAPEPSIVLVREEGVEVIPRPDLWGLTVSATREALLKLYPDMGILTIGPAGERLVPMAAVRGNESHAAARCGPGAMLGSKNIKAVLAGGRARPPVVDREGLRTVGREALEAIRKDPFLTQVQGPIGTPNLVEPVNTFHAFPTGNFRQRHFETAHRIYGDRIAKDYVCSRTTCPGCPVRCRLHVRIGEEEMEAAEYESLWAFGGDNCIDDYPLIVRAVTLCNELGLDTISAGNTIAFYREYTGTLHDPSGVLELVRSLAYREGVGDILARGTRSAAEHFGVDYAMHVKGLEIAAYDPRRLTGMAISYSTTNRGGCHSRAWTVGDELTGKDFSGAELAELVFKYHNEGCIRDSLIMCTFLTGPTRPFYPQALTCVLGRNITEADIARTGERIFTLERLLNIRRGVDASQDTLPRRLLEGLVAPEKYREGMRVYYQLRDWDERGRPSAGKCRELGLEFKWLQPLLA